MIVYLAGSKASQQRIELPGYTILQTLAKGGE
jgi:hypothetical protein